MASVGAERPTAMCIVTVSDGPADVRWALVAVNLDPAADPSRVRRSRRRTSAEVLAVVAQFLADAGLDDPSR